MGKTVLGGFVLFDDVTTLIGLWVLGSLPEKAQENCAQPCEIRHSFLACITLRPFPIT